MKKIIVLFLMMGNIMMGAVDNVTQIKSQQEHVYVVILAGGSGERLWPLSRINLPKQLLVVGEQQTLLEQAIDRVRELVPQKNIYISTTAQHADKIRAAVGNTVGKIMIEPGSRNTGPAILLCCLELYKQDPQAVIAFLPADPFIPHKKHFVGFLEQAIEHVKHHDNIALLGLQPRYPATGYGYIEFNPHDNRQNNGIYPVIKFHEKPSLPIAQQYVASGTTLWNSGMFCGKASVFIDEFRKYAPQMLSEVNNYLAGKSTYEIIKNESIDYAVMEKSSSICVLPSDFAWCDVGNVEIFLSLKQQYATQQSNVLTVAAKNNLVDVPNKLVALVGVDDLCIVETDNTLLITRRDTAEQVKLIVKQLKDAQKTEYL